MLADAVPPQLPDPNHFSSIGWVIVIFVMAIVGLNAILNFYEDHIRERPTPSETYVTIPNFEKLEKERKEDRARIIDKLDALVENIACCNRHHSRARMQIYSRINGMDSALSFIAGRFERDGDHSAAQAIEQKLHAARAGGDDE